MKIGFQLWSVHQLLETDDQAELIIKAIKLAGYEGVELFNIGDPEMFDRVTSLLSKYELPIISSHCDYDLLVNSLDEVINRYKPYQLQSLVVPIAFDITKSVDDMYQVISNLQQVRKECNSRGLELYYHNHDCECLMLDGKYIIDHLGLAGIKLEYDVHWLVRGGLNPYTEIQKFPSTQLHIKDVKLVNDNDEFKLIDCAVGSGTLDLAALVETCFTQQIEWVFVEQEHNSSDVIVQIEDIQKSYDAIQNVRRTYEN